MTNDKLPLRVGYSADPQTGALRATAPPVEPAALTVVFDQPRRVIGWTVGDGSGHEGYHVEDYFDPTTGEYLGPDAHGIEPIFEKDHS